MELVSFQISGLARVLVSQYWGPFFHKPVSLFSSVLFRIL